MKFPSSIVLQKISARLNFAASGLAGFLLALGALQAPAVFGQTATATSLSMTAGGSAATSVAAGTVLTLTASVAYGTTPVTTGQVDFCDAAANYCTDVHLLGAAQLTANGTAVLRFRPAPGSHLYKAVFVGTNTNAASSSAAQALNVTSSTGVSPATVQLSSTGTWGQYSLTATVEGLGDLSPITGNISIQDTNNGNAVLATAGLGASTPGLYWPTQAPCQSYTGPNQLLVADFNGDGYPDYVAVNQSADQVVTYVYQPSSGCYTQVGTYSTFGYPQGALVADFNGDGNLDIAIANQSANIITILLGHGDGTFTQSSVTTTGFNNFLLTSADFNGDGIPDLVIYGQYASTITVLLGKGDGTFTTAPSLAVSNFRTVVAGDFNGDGKTDLVLADALGGIEFYFGNGDGTFAAGTPANQVPNSASISSMSVADFNGDGKLDLAVTSAASSSSGSPEVMIYLGKGDGTFTAAGSAVISAFTGPTQVADFNLDGIPDVAAGSGGEAAVFLGQGDGTFKAQSYIANPGNLYYAGFAVADVDGDGRPDILYTAQSPSGSVQAYVGLTKPMMTASTAPISIAPTVGEHLAVADYSGDANSTSAVSSPIELFGTPLTSATALALSANGGAASTVSPGTEVTLTATVTGGGHTLTSGQVNFCDASAPSCTDIHLLGIAQLTSNGTAVLNLVPGPGNHSYQAVFLANGFGTLSVSPVATLTVTPPAPSLAQTTTTIAQSGSIGNYTLTATLNGIGTNAPLTGNVSFLDTSYSNSVLATAAVSSSTPGFNWDTLSSTPFSNVAWLISVAGDFNGDGVPDLAVVNPNVTAVTIELGNGDGTFKTPTTLPLTTYPAALVAGDFNGDGKLDLAVSSTGPNYNSPGTLSIFLGNGNGTFTAGYSGTGFGSVFAVADFDRDGKLDLLTSNNGATKVLFGKGDGTFSAPVTAGAYQTFAVADLNGDGVPDLIGQGTTTVNGAYVTTTLLYLGNGDGTFRQTGTTFTPSSSEGIQLVTIGDFNGDGIPDVAVDGNYYSSPVIFLGKGDGTFTQAPGATNSSVNETLSMVAADLNQDGKLDLILTNANSGSYAGYVNTINPDFVVLLGDGDGTFTPVGANTMLGNTAYAVVADFNGDGKQEIALQAGSNLVLLRPKVTQTATATVTGISPSGPAPHLVAASYPGDSNYTASTSSTTSLQVQVATPVLSSPPGTYTSLASIAITDSTPGATIYYSGSGSITTSGYVPYTGPIPVYGSGSTTLSVYATETGYQQSATATANYTFSFSQQTAAPTLSLPSGVYTGSQQITIASSTPGALIFYTTDGSVPGIYSTAYSGPLTISTPTVLNAIAVAPGYSVSGSTGAQYLFSGAATPLIYTVAGNGMPGYTGDGGPATQAEIGISLGATFDKTGNLYFSDTYNNVIRRVDATTGNISTFAGTGTGGFSGDGGPAAQAQFSYPAGLAFDAAGDLYIADTLNNRVRRIDAKSGNVSTVIGGAPFAISGTGSTQLINPESVAVDGAGNLYIANVYGLLEIVTATNSNTWIGNSFAGQSVAVDGSGNVFFMTGTYTSGYSTYSPSIFKIPAGTTPGSNLSLTSYCIVGCGITYGGSTASTAFLYNAQSIAVDALGNLYIADTGYNLVQKLAVNANILTSVSSPYASQETGDGGLPAGAGVVAPLSLAVDSSGNLAITDQMARIRKIINFSALPASATATPSLSVAAGSYGSPQAVTISDTTPGASIYYSLSGSSPNAGGGGYFGPIKVDGSVTVQAIAVAPGYLPSTVASAAYTISSPPASTISTVAGSAHGNYTYCSSIAGNTGVQALQAGMGQPQNVAVDGAGNLYISDSYCNAVWKVAAQTAVISLYAGSGSPIYSGSSLGDGGPAPSARLNAPRGLVLDSKGNLYIADYGDNLVREVNASTGIISSVAGNGNSSYLTTTGNGDGGLATSATLGLPTAIAIDSSGNLYVADRYYRVREVAASTGLINTIAGNGTFGYSGDGGPAANAEIESVNALSLDYAGNLYISDGGVRVRRVAAGTGVITTVAGVGIFGFYGDGGPATKAQISTNGLVADPLGDLYLSCGNMVRFVSATTGTISTIAGSGIPGYWGDGGAATVAGMRAISGLAFDATGNLYAVDSGNDVIRQVVFANNPAQTALPSFTPVAGTYVGAQSVAITDSTPHAAIYYTTDGSIPTASSTAYSGAISVSSNQTVRALALANGYFNSSVASAAYTILTPQTINFAALPATVTYGAAPIPLSASSSSGLPVSFSVVSGPASISGSTLTITGGGTVVVAANQAGNSTYGPAQAAQTLIVQPAQPTITWAPPAAILTGTSLSSVLTASASFNSTAVPGTFSYTATPAGGSASAVSASTLLPAGSYTLNAAFLPANASNFAGSTVTATLAVNNPQPAISTVSPTIVQAGGAGFTLTVTGAGFVPGSTVYWGGTPLNTALQSGTTLQASVSAALIAAPGVVNVTVQTPAPGGGTSTSLQFEIDTGGSSGSAPTFASPTATVSAGQTASYAVTPSSNASNLSVTCLNLPSGATCSYSAATNTVSIATAATTPSGTYQITVVFNETITTTTAGWILAPFLLLPLFFIRRRLTADRVWVCLALALAIGVAAATGCGGSSSTQTQKTTQTQVTASSTVTLIVK